MIFSINKTKPTYAYINNWLPFVKMIPKHSKYTVVYFESPIFPSFQIKNSGSYLFQGIHYRKVMVKVSNTDKRCKAIA